MSGKAIGIQLNLGYPGTVSRSVDTIITPKIVKSNESNGIESAKSIGFGEAVVLNEDNTYSRFKDTNTADDFVGIAVREVKQSISYNEGNGSYLPGEVCDVLNRGTICIKCNNGNPKARGKVYLRITENVAITNCVVGQFEAVADGSNTVEVPNLRWTTGKLDSNKVAEVTLLNRTI